MTSTQELASYRKRKAQEHADNIVMLAKHRQEAFTMEKSILTVQSAVEHLARRAMLRWQIALITKCRHELPLKSHPDGVQSSERSASELKELVGHFYKEWEAWLKAETAIKAYSYQLQYHLARLSKLPSEISSATISQQEVWSLNKSWECTEAKFPELKSALTAGVLEAVRMYQVHPDANKSSPRAIVWSCAQLELPLVPSCSKDVLDSIRGQMVVEIKALDAQMNSQMRHHVEEDSKALRGILKDFEEGGPRNEYIGKRFQDWAVRVFSRTS